MFFHLYLHSISTFMLNIDTPTCLSLQIGDRADSTSYIKAKSKAANEVKNVAYSTVVTEFFHEIYFHQAK